MAARTTSEMFSHAIEHHQAGRLPQAEALYREILARDPSSVDALHLLGVIAHQVGRHDVALDLIGRAAILAPNNPAIHSNLGEAYRHLHRFDEAIASFRRALTLRPEYPDALNNLGSVLVAQGRFDEALTCFQQALALKPDYAIAHYNLGNLFLECHRVDEAVLCFKRTVALKPDFAEAHACLGTAFKDCGRLDEAIASLERALAHKPEFPEAYNNLGNVFKELGQIDDAIAHFRQALAQKPDYAKAHSNVILALHYHSADTAGSIEVEQRDWNRQHAAPLVGFIRPHANDRSPGRRLRVGYVSQDFRQHPVGLNLIPLFEHHAHDQFEIFCYSQVRTPDGPTAKLRACSDHWLDIVQLGDSELADLVCRDRIDILVDLALHTAKNRLLTFACKPAPVQVSFAGYPAGTGLDAIDYHLTDHYLNPIADNSAPSHDAPYRLPDTFWCYDPQAADLPVRSLPAIANGRPTFGSLNNLCKINPAVIRLWARVLLAVPTSRLVLLAVEGSYSRRVLELFSQVGVSPDRIVLTFPQPRQKYLAFYQCIDLGLDTFPYNGHTTSLDSYWMGVPVVTLVGQNPVGRAGWSQLSNLGLTELAAHTPDDFVRIASTLARDLPRLAALRAGLRERMQRSPLMDAPRFARAVETAFRTMWHRWCALPAPPPILTH